MMILKSEIRVSDEYKQVSTTSKGDQTKWKIGNKWVKSDKFGYEGVAEHLSSKILEFSNIKTPFVKYDIVNIIDNEFSFNGCVSEDFMQDDEIFISLYRLFFQNRININKLYDGKSTDERINLTIQLIKELTRLDITQYLRDIFTLDGLILNEDRHLNNIAVILNTKTRQFRICPIFDNGLSLLADTIDFPHQTSVTVNVRRVKSKPFNSDFKKQMKVLGSGFTVNKEKLKQYIYLNFNSLGRAGEVILYQFQQYPEIFV